MFTRKRNFLVSLDGNLSFNSNFGIKDILKDVQHIKTATREIHILKFFTQLLKIANV